LDLERREKSRAFLAEKDIIRFFGSICEALLVFHTMSPHPLAHRDLKTANILLDDNFNPIIMDLGEWHKYIEHGTYRNGSQNWPS
jgi:serine/threonine kinase 16